MIKLFRKIRQKLIEQQKVRSYFFYAIGEIFLVVIGILIAISINNWNQNKTYKNELNQIVKEVSNDLNQDIEFLNLMIEISEETIYSIDNLLNNDNKMSEDSLLINIVGLHRFTYFVPTNFGYNKLNKHPRTELLPDSLTNNLTTYYTGYSIERNEIISETGTLYNFNYYRNYLVKFGFPLEMNGLGLVRPKDLSQLNFIINDTEFIGILRNSKAVWTSELGMLIDAREFAKNNLETINSYLVSIN
ncbi:DUF6090 family protein [Marivirga sp.]|uniref:DUF6090 family protein n=1 Tax=Marivirga sp. TaxID=2018662 RepID=UPI0025D14C0E|nr:DUF6090 family protein [Marivirga sp.]